MAITHGTTIRNTLADDVGAALANGNCVLKEGTTVICTIPLGATPFGAASGGTITLSGTPSGTASASTTNGVDTFEMQDSGGAIVYTGTVTATGGGGDMEISNTTIAANETVTITSHSYTAAP